MTDVLIQNDRFFHGCTKMTDAVPKLPILNSRKGPISEKYGSFWYQNDRLSLPNDQLYIPNWPIIDKMTDCGLKWPFLKFLTHSSWLKWPIMRTKMSYFGQQTNTSPKWPMIPKWPIFRPKMNDCRDQNDLFKWPKWPIIFTKMTNLRS